jgi:hypothetical protein
MAAATQHTSKTSCVAAVPASGAGVTEVGAVGEQGPCVRFTRGKAQLTE